MEDSDDDTPLQVLADSARWAYPTSVERKAFENFSNNGIQTLCPATPLVTSASCSGRYDVFKASTGNIELPNPFKAVADKMKLLGSDSTDEANLNLCDKKTKANKNEDSRGKEGQRYNDMFSKEVRDKSRIAGTRKQSEFVSQ